MSKHFSKTSLIEELEYRADVIRKRYGFHIDNGTSQLKPGDSEQAMAYAEMRAWLDLSEDLDSGYWLTVRPEGGQNV